MVRHIAGRRISACNSLSRARLYGGAIVPMFVSGRRSPVPAFVIGVFFTGCGIMNLSSIPHPSWFPFVDIPVYIIPAMILGILLKRRDDDVSESTADSMNIQP